jgi:hypothetical protein
VAAQIPVLTGMGNHEILYEGYDVGWEYPLAFDRWPYASESSEAVFAREFCNPRNGPEPEFPGGPPYKENVYSVQWGNVLILMLNTNYWYSALPETWGGNLEGVIMDGQLDWLEKRIRQAAADSTVDWIIYTTHEPTFPNGGHLEDGMWYSGGAPEFNDGFDRRWVLERRDRWWKLVSGCSKSLAVIHGDEHNYSRLLVDDRMPVYPDGSVQPDFRYPVWQIISGGGGAPYYRQGRAPWSDRVASFSTQQHLVLLRVSGRRVDLEAVSRSGEIIDTCRLDVIRP